MHTLTCVLRKLVLLHLPTVILMLMNWLINIGAFTPFLQVVLSYWFVYRLSNKLQIRVRHLVAAAAASLLLYQRQRRQQHQHETETSMNLSTSRSARRTWQTSTPFKRWTWKRWSCANCRRSYIKSCSSQSNQDATKWEGLVICKKKTLLSSQCHQALHKYTCCALYWILQALGDGWVTAPSTAKNSSAWMISKRADQIASSTHSGSTMRRLSSKPCFKEVTQRLCLP